MSMGFTFDTTKFKKNFDKFKKENPAVLKDAFAKAGIQLISWMNEGSKSVATRPPIEFGVLVGSAAVHIGKNFIGVYQKENGTPYTGTISEKDFTVTISYNTAYAEWLHNGDWNPGPRSKQAGGVGNKWLKKHLDGDKKDFINLVNIFYEKGVSEI